MEKLLQEVRAKPATSNIEPGKSGKSGKPVGKDVIEVEIESGSGRGRSRDKGSSDADDEPARQRPFLTVNQAKWQLNLGQTRLYELLNEGSLEAVRLGGRTLISAESIDRFLSGLPRLITPTMLRRHGAALRAEGKDVRGLQAPPPGTK